MVEPQKIDADLIKKIHVQLDCIFDQCINGVSLEVRGLTNPIVLCCGCDDLSRIIYASRQEDGCGIPREFIEHLFQRMQPETVIKNAAGDEIIVGNVTITYPTSFRRKSMKVPPKHRPRKPSAQELPGSTKRYNPNFFAGAAFHDGAFFGSVHPNV